MAWARIDDGFHDHPKVDELSLAAVGLWTLSLTWAHRHRKTAILPGHITDARARKIAGKQADTLAAELVAARLWDVEQNIGGWEIHDFTDYLPKQRDPSELRDAGRKGMASRWKPDSKPDSKLLPDSNTADSKPVAADNSCASAPASPSRPVPVDELQGGWDRDGTLPASPATAPHPNEPICSKHPNGDTGEACAGCARRNAWNERNDSKAREQAARAALGCPDCGGTGWREHPDSGLPAGRCTHPNVRRAS